MDTLGNNQKQDDLFQKYHKSSLYWKKDYHINFISGDEQHFDDFFKIYNLKNQRIISITVWKDKQKYITGFQATYEGKDDQGKLTSVKGFSIHPQKNFDLNHQEKQTLNLENDEFITTIFGRNGNNIDQLGFLTSKGKTLKIGGEGGNPFRITAPNGYHFSCLSGACDHEFLKQVKANIYSIEDVQAKNKKQQIFPPRIFQMIIPYLALKVKLTQSNLSFILQMFYKQKDIGNVFLCQGFSYFRGNDTVINKIGRQCIYSVNDTNIEYLNQLISNEKNFLQIKNELILGQKKQQDFDKLTELIQVTRNRIRFDQILDSPSLYFRIENQNYIRISKSYLDLGNNLCVETSYNHAPITFQASFADLFTKQELEDLLNGDYAIVIGAKCKDSGQGGQITLNLKLKLSQHDKFDSTVSKNKLSLNYKPFYFFLDPHLLKRSFTSLSELSECEIQFKVQGKDEKMWSGFYGPKISDIFLRILPANSEFDQQELQLTKRFCGNK